MRRLWVRRKRMTKKRIRGERGKKPGWGNLVMGRKMMNVKDPQCMDQVGFQHFIMSLVFIYMDKAGVDEITDENKHLVKQAIQNAEEDSHKDVWEWWVVTQYEERACEYMDLKGNIWKKDELEHLERYLQKNKEEYETACEVVGIQKDDRFLPV